jgi:2-polyprenyl-3-methyl-5-hydroxy-6-metoxy-1,4-benzoquinol methylase
MHAHICPWWLTYTFDNPLRKLLHNPTKILSPYIREEMNVADIGCGMGYFTPTLASLVGPNGHVQAVDLQEQQLSRVKKRCGQAGVAERVECTQASTTSLNLKAPLDFVLAFWMVHEVPDAKRFFVEIKNSLKPSGMVLIAEPKLHAGGTKFQATVDICQQLGFKILPVNNIRASRSVVLSG